MTTIKEHTLAAKQGIYQGAFLKKEAPATGDAKAAEAALLNLTTELSSVMDLLEKSKKDSEQHYTDLNNHFGGVKAENEELKKTVLQHAAEYADMITKQQTMQQIVDQIKKEMDVPLLKGGSDLADNDRKAAIELQRRIFLSKGGNNFEFKADMENLVDASVYRGVVRKLMSVGLEQKNKITRSFDDIERKAFEAAGLDSAMFSPEMLGIELNCIVECAELLDLYGQATVGKSTFMYPQVMDYGAIGQYDCDAKCDAEYGPEGNVQFKAGNVSDFRGVFCLHRRTLQEANYDLLGFMYNAAARSHRINRNRALINGDGVNEPLGWVTAGCFPNRKSQSTTFTHQEWRMFYSAVPVEYGPVTAVMHQNTFAYLASQIDADGRFIFGDGLMTYNPNDVRENIRISNCLPDPTDNLKKGTAANPFTTGDFIAGVGAWNVAYYAVSKRPLWIEQWEGQSSAWCVKYQFGAEDGGFVGCCPAASILSVGP
jgi:Phage capsid family